MTKKYEIILKYIKDLSVEIPNAETFVFSREYITCLLYTSDAADE